MDYLLVPSRKKIELIRFGKIDFPIYITEFFLNIRIFLKKFGSSMKKSILSKLHRTLRRIIFVYFVVVSRSQVRIYKAYCDERR